MKLKIFALFLFTLSAQLIKSQELDYTILTIPDSLTQKANSIIRQYDMSIELKSSKKMITKISKVVTALNKIGNHESNITIHYDKNTSIKSLKAIFYNSLGGEIKKITKNKFEDYAAADGISLHNDGRVKYYKYVPTTYPYTMHLEYEVETSNTAFIPMWLPIDSYNQSIQKSSFKISHPAELKLTNLERNFANFNIIKSHTGNIFQYEIKNQTAFKREEHSPEFIQIFPSVKFASNKFHLEGYDGSASNWNEFGKWRYDYLKNGNDKINESTKIKIQKLVEKVTDPIKKARIIYEYVQNKTRYISVQEGIGGWKPAKADEVDRLGYGDCKGLTNYTKALLDAVGVKSHYSVLWAGDAIRNVEEDFFSMQGNHVILNLPTKNGEIWLECTSQTAPFGYQGSFTDNRNALVITPNGGVIKATTSYKNKDNFKNTIAEYTIDSKGKLTSNIEIKSKGVKYEDHSYLEKKNKRELEKYYKDNYWDYINNLVINNVEFNNNKKDIIFKESLDVSAENYASISSDRMLIRLNAFNRNTSSLKRYRNRKFPLYIARGFYDKDEFTINLPKGFSIEALPENTTIENKFGSYSIEIEKINDSQLKYKRSLLILKGTHPKEEYSKYRKFRKKVSKLDNSKIILIKNQQ